jgi:hypothetical protein
MNLVLLAEKSYPLPYVMAFFITGLILLLIPAYRVFVTRERSQALVLFKRASCYPLALLIVMTIKTLA